MRVVKRTGEMEPVAFDKIQTRLRKLCEDPRLPELRRVDVARVVAQVCSSVHDGMTTVRLDELTAEIAQAMVTEHPEYGQLASRVLVSNLQKATAEDPLGAFRAMQDVLDPAFLEAAEAHADELRGMVDYARDYAFDFFGFKTMERMYLARVGDRVVERPQHMFLRVALGLWHRGGGEGGEGGGEGADLARVRETYDCLSRQLFTHASPTLFNAGMRHAQLASCFLTGVEEDSLDAIFAAVTKCAHISKFGGGIGLHVSGVRGRGARIGGTNGQSDGLVPMLRMFDVLTQYVNQGGRRKGSIAVYLEPHHPDVMDVLAMKRNSGEEHLRARDLFYALWVPDLFMERVVAGGTWSLMDPAACPGLCEVWGAEYRELYERYEREGRAARTLPAREVWAAVLRSQAETGGPYLCFKDAANAKSNQQHLGTIKCSNLCSEVVEYTAPDEVAVCTLGSLSLPAFVRDGTFDFAALAAATRVLARNLDRVIDVNFYPVEEARTSNVRHRPLGIGVQGLQDVFFEPRLPYESAEAAALNRAIFEAIYFAACEASCQLAREVGPHPSYPGSPASRGLLQPDLWGATPSDAWDWAGLRASVAAHGLRNSLLVAPMPTASTAQLLGNTEAFEPITSNIYSRRTLAGEFVVVNARLVRDLVERGLWTREVKDAIVAAGGSVQRVQGVPDDLKALYKTAWEMSMRALIDLAADRGPFVCQSQSLNLFKAQPTDAELTSMHVHAWRRGLKTGVYYLRTLPAARAVQITVDPATAAACLACSG